MSKLTDGKEVNAIFASNFMQYAKAQRLRSHIEAITEELRVGNQLYAELTDKYGDLQAERDEAQSLFEDANQLSFNRKERITGLEAELAQARAKNAELREIAWGCLGHTTFHGEDAPNHPVACEWCEGIKAITKALSDETAPCEHKVWVVPAAPLGASGEWWEADGAPVKADVVECRACHITADKVEVK